MPLVGEEKREYQRRWYAARRESFFRDKVCVRCGSRDRLELDHVDRSNKTTHNIWSWSEERRQDEIAKCQVLCYTCHKEKTKLEFTATEVPHGTPVGYKKRGCRCMLCSKAFAAYRKNFPSRQSKTMRV